MRKKLQNKCLQSQNLDSANEYVWMNKCKQNRLEYILHK